jgi:CheY-like chemotaxis protein
MVEELLSLRVLVASGSTDDRDRLRRAAAAATVPIEIIEAHDTASARHSIAGGFDLAFLDATLGSDAVARIAAAARAARKAPSTVLLAGVNAAPSFATDALAQKPTDAETARHFVEGAIRLCVPSRVLVVDDSPTMRSIVRKTLAATRFPLQVTEVAQGADAIELARSAAFDVVFVDYNLPGFDGLQTIAEFRRENGQVIFVLISSTQDEALAARARALGAAFLKKPFFPADIESLLCGFYGLRALAQNRG